MSRSPHRGRRVWLVQRLKTVLAVYVLAAALLPLAHHDIVCHAKSTTHCSTCVVGSSGEAAADPCQLARLSLTRLGEAICGRLAAPVSASLSPGSGRAPPAFA